MDKKMFCILPDKNASQLQKNPIHTNELQELLL